MYLAALALAVMVGALGLGSPAGGGSTVQPQTVVGGGPEAVATSAPGSTMQPQTVVGGGPEATATTTP